VAHKYRLTHAALFSLLLLLVGLLGTSARLLYLLVAGSLDLAGTVPFVLIFAAGVAVYLWDRRNQRTVT
jgi:quinol-cytochrome oxidoreductase complex cytochrome b subunit